MKFLLRSIERIDPGLFIFILLCLNFLNYSPGSNEEIYLALSKQMVDPSWMPTAFDFNEPSGSRYIFQLITGFGLKFMSFEAMVFFGRMINFALLAIPLGMIFRHFGLKNIHIILSLQIIFFTHQTFFAGEWIFGGFESKTLAYALIFFAIAYWLKGKAWWTIGFLIFATYFHVLVGGWMVIAMIIYRLIIEKPNNQLFRDILIYSVAVIPFAVYLYFSRSCENILPAEFNPNKIYTFLRNPHHIGIARDWEYFKTEHLTGVVLALAAFISMIVWFKRTTEVEVKKMIGLDLTILGIVLLMVIVAVIDRGGNMMIFYPFRPASIALLILAILAGILFHRSVSSDPILPNSIVLIFGFALLFNQTFKNIDENYLAKSDHPEDLYEFIKKNTTRDDLFLLQGEGYWDILIPFSRKTERPRFFTYKFTPVDDCRLLEWYTRYQMQQNFGWDNEELFRIKERYGLDYLLTIKPIDDPRAREVFSEGSYILYDIR